VGFAIPVGSIVGLMLVGQVFKAERTTSYLFMIGYCWWY